MLDGTAAPPADDPAVRASAALYAAAYCAERDATKAALSERDTLLAQLLALQQAASEETFYPDANGCLRLSAGH
eukprot:5571132-Prymnesium_polylepis.1